MHTTGKVAADYSLRLNENMKEQVKHISSLKTRVQHCLRIEFKVKATFGIHGIKEH